MGYHVPPVMAQNGELSAWYNRKKKIVPEEARDTYADPRDNDDTRDMLIDFIHDNDERMADLGALSLRYGKQIPKMQAELERIIESIRKINRRVGYWQSSYLHELTVVERIERLERHAQIQ